MRKKVKIMFSYFECNLLVNGMNEWCDKNGVRNIGEISGTVKKW